MNLLCPRQNVSVQLRRILELSLNCVKESSVIEDHIQLSYNGLCLFGYVFSIEAHKVDKRNFHRTVFFYLVSHCSFGQQWICHCIAAKDRALQRVILDFPREDAPPPTGLGFNRSSSLLFCYPLHSLSRPKRRSAGSRNV